MNEIINVQILDMDPMVAEQVVKNHDDSFTIFLNARLNYERRLEAYQHAIRHIENDDFYKTDVQRIEAEAHGLVKPLPIEPTVKTAKRRKPRWLTMMEKRIELLEAFGIDPNEHALDQRDRTVM